MITNWDGDTLFERYGSVETDARAPSAAKSGFLTPTSGDFEVDGRKFEFPKTCPKMRAIKGQNCIILWYKNVS